MWNLKISKKYFLAFFVISTAFFGQFFFARNASAANPQTFITWKAKNYVPSFFSGKILPGSNTPILASLEIIENGKVANLSNIKIYWYLNNKLFDRGIGLQSIAIRTPQILGGGLMNIRAQVPDYPGESISKDADIPLVPPSVVLDAPYAQNKLSSLSAEIHAWPYFFGVQDISYLTFGWKLNGKDIKALEDPQRLIVNINSNAAPGSILSIASTITNPNGYFESGDAKKSLTFSP